MKLKGMDINKELENGLSYKRKSIIRCFFFRGPERIRTAVRPAAAGLPTTQKLFQKIKGYHLR